MEDSPERDRIAERLARKGGVDATASQIALDMLATCQAVQAALVPILGHRGVAALHRRSMHLAGRDHPWLMGTPSSERNSEDLSSILQTLVARQTAGEAAAGGAAFLHAFHGLLVSLVGASLTERLLRRVWIEFLGSPPAQDTET